MCRKHGITDAIYFNCKSKYGGKEIPNLKYMKRMYAHWRARGMRRMC